MAPSKFLHVDFLTCRLGETCPDAPSAVRMEKAICVVDTRSQFDRWRVDVLALANELLHLASLVMATRQPPNEQQRNGSLAYRRVRCVC